MMRRVSGDIGRRRNIGRGTIALRAESRPPTAAPTRSWTEGGCASSDGTPGNAPADASCASREGAPSDDGARVSGAAAVLASVLAVAITDAIERFDLSELA